MITDITVKRTKDNNSAISIAESNPHYFNKLGIRKMKDDFINHLLFGAFLHDRMIGFINYKKINPNVIELIWMAVDPTHHNQGIGSKLVVESLKFFSDKYKVCQTKTLSEIDPDPQYKRTREFYTKIGFISLDSTLIHPQWGLENPCQIFIKLL